MAESETTNKGLLVVSLVGLNILCLGAVIGASVLLPRENPAGMAHSPEQASASATSAAGATATAEAHGEGAPSGSAEPAKEAASAAPSASAAADASQGAVRAVVAPPGADQKGVIRYKPDPKARMVLMLPAGATVEITDKLTTGKQDWYQVKTVDAARPVTGWMHGNVLKMQ